MRDEWNIYVERIRQEGWKGDISKSILWADSRIKALEDAVEWACRHLDRLDNPEFKDKLSDELRRRAGLLPEDVG